jgi:hypothetical protein
VCASQGQQGEEPLSKFLNKKETDHYRRPGLWRFLWVHWALKRHEWPPLNHSFQALSAEIEPSPPARRARRRPEHLSVTKPVIFPILSADCQLIDHDTATAVLLRQFVDVSLLRATPGVK